MSMASLLTFLRFLLPFFAVEVNYYFKSNQWRKKEAVIERSSTRCELFYISCLTLARSFLISDCSFSSLTDLDSSFQGPDYYPKLGYKVSAEEASPSHSTCRSEPPLLFFPVSIPSLGSAYGQRMFQWTYRSNLLRQRALSLGHGTRDRAHEIVSRARSEVHRLTFTFTKDKAGTIDPNNSYDVFENIYLSQRRCDTFR